MNSYTLTDLGWSDHFAHQVSDDDAGLTPVRITEVQRETLTGLGPDGFITLAPKGNAGDFAVGDWVLHDGVWALKVLEPQSDMVRKAAGHRAGRQRIAANIDTIAVVTSCNADFNIPRLERYLALVASTGALPLIVLTKADLDAAQDYIRQAQGLGPLVTVVALNAKDPDEAHRLLPWCKDGQTLALVGSSGVGKTTLRNALTGNLADTQGIREDDARGRHTTTFRSMSATVAGGWLIDTPGMRELQLTDAAEGIDAVFSDIDDLIRQCRFSDCTHQSEPGCAVREAIEAGELDPDRLERYEKLLREDEINSESIAQRHERTRNLEKTYKEGKARGRNKRRGR